MDHYLTNAELREDTLPSSEAIWEDINRFSHTFDGYTAAGSFERCAEIARERRHETLTELRTCLFFEARSWRHGGESPEIDELAYEKGLI